MNTSQFGSLASSGPQQTESLGSELLFAEPANSGELPENGKVNKVPRKAYTLTKSRERWSEEEHARFVEAVRLYGRAWRKIEDHIGTKTAVQIRSHAQKFFNKLEKKKEAGELPEEDIAIPPPRPKRKPSKPYPRKDGVSSSGLTGTSQLQTSSQMPASSTLPPGVHAALQHAFMLQPQQQQQQQQQSQGPVFQQQQPQQQQVPYGLPPSLEGLLHSFDFDSLTTASSLASGQLQQQMPQQQQQHHAGEVTDATVAAVTAAASAAAAAAAAAVVAAAGQEVQLYMQAHPPSCFPFFGMPPSVFAQLAPGGPPGTLDQAVTAAEHAAAATAAAYRFGGSAAAEAAAAAPAVAAAVAAANAAAGVAAAADEPDDDMAGIEEVGGAGGDRSLVEATGTTDGTHVSANAQLRGSDGDSACSRETDNQDADGDADATMDVTWQDKLQEQQQQQPLAGTAPNPAACGLGGLAGGALGPQWGLGGAMGAPDAGSAMAAASQMLSALGPAQMLALLSNPVYLAAVNQHLSQHAAGTAAAAVAPHVAPVHQHTRTQPSGLDRTSGGAAAGTSMRSKSRRTAPSVNSGSTGPPLGTKRPHPADGQEEAAQAAKKAARDVSEGDDEPMEGSPGSPSIQEKHIKAASQPSTTNGNTSGSNESDASKRRQGTTQGEGSNPASVKDSNTATHTNGCSGHGSGSGKAHTNGNGTSAFHPLGHSHHSHTHNGHAARRPKAHTSSAPTAAAAKAPNGHHHHNHNHSSHNAPGGAEGSNGGNGMSGTNNGMSGTNNNTSGTNDASGRDEGRSSSDLDGPTQQQLLQRHPRMLQAQQAAEEDTAGGQLQEGQAEQQGNPAAAQLQALLSSLHGMCGASPMMQAYGTAAAAAAQQMLASALHDLPGPEMQQQQNAFGPQVLAALQEQLAQASIVASQQQQQQQVLHTHAPGSQGFAPWQAHTSAGVAGVAANDAVSAQLAAAAAGLMGLQQQHFQQRPFSTSAVQADPAADAAVLQAAAAAAVAAAQQAASRQHHPQGLQQRMPAAAGAAAALNGFTQLSGLELLSHAAHSAGAVGGCEAGTGGSSGGRQSRASRSSDQAAPRSRQPTKTL